MIPAIGFSSATPANTGSAVILADKKIELGPLGTDFINQHGEWLRAAALAEGFDGKLGSAVSITAPSEINCERIIILGMESKDALGQPDWQRLGGLLMGKLENSKQQSVSVLLESNAITVSGENAADFALGIQLRAYKFDKYKMSGKNNQAKPLKFSLRIADARAARRHWIAGNAVSEGVRLARDLVNEPPNILTTVEFTRRASHLSELGVKIEILGENEMRRLKMNALLGVAQGAATPPRLVTLRWNGTRASSKPLAFIGKGVTFDSGGLSIKPAGGMEDMKGDMGGAAAVTGLIHTLATRKARVNAIGVIALVENMPDGAAQRPGDIVTAMSGKNIEIHNTDAEGRLVLADALHYTLTKYNPALMVNLATLTGAIIVALGHHYAGLFSNNDELAESLIATGKTVGERVWRMPLDEVYDKLINSPIADIKNVGGRSAGAITAAQFLQHFVGDTAWAHLDIAGVAMNSPKNAINQGWTSGFGVQLLNNLILENYEN